MNDGFQTPELDVRELISHIATHVHLNLSEIITEAQQSISTGRTASKATKDQVDHVLSVTRKVLIKLYALVKFFLAQAISAQSKFKNPNLCRIFDKDIERFRQIQVDNFQKAASLSRIYQFVATIRAPSYDIPTATDLITSGSCQTVPNYLLNEAELMGDALLNRASCFVAEEESKASRLSYLYDAMLGMEVTKSLRSLDIVDSSLSLNFFDVFQVLMTLSKDRTRWVIFDIQPIENKGSSTELVLYLSKTQKEYLLFSLHRFLEAADVNVGIKKCSDFLTSFYSFIKSKQLRKNAIRLSNTTFRDVISVETVNMDSNPNAILLINLPFRQQASLLQESGQISVKMYHLNKNIQVPNFPIIVDELLRHNEFLIKEEFRNSFPNFTLELRSQDGMCLNLGSTSTFRILVDRFSGSVSFFFHTSFIYSPIVFEFMDLKQAIPIFPRIIVLAQVSIFASYLKTFKLKSRVKHSSTFVENESNSAKRIKLSNHDSESMAQTLFELDGYACSVFWDLDSSFHFSVKISVSKKEHTIAAQEIHRKFFVEKVDVSVLFPQLIREFQSIVGNTRANSLYSVVSKVKLKNREIGFTEMQEVKAVFVKYSKLHLKLVFVPTSPKKWFIYVFYVGAALDDIVSCMESSIRFGSGEMFSCNLEKALCKLQYDEIPLFEGFKDQIADMRQILPSPGGIQQIFDSVQGLNTSPAKEQPEIQKLELDKNEGDFVDVFDQNGVEESKHMNLQDALSLQMDCFSKDLTFILGICLVKKRMEKLSSILENEGFMIEFNDFEALNVLPKTTEISSEMRLPYVTFDFSKSLINVVSPVCCLEESMLFVLRDGLISIFFSIVQAELLQNEAVPESFHSKIFSKWVQIARSAQIYCELSNAEQKVRLAQSMAQQSAGNSNDHSNGGAAGRMRGKKSLQLMQRNRVTEEKVDSVKAHQFGPQRFYSNLRLVVYSLELVRICATAEDGSKSTIRIRIGANVTFSGVGKKWTEALNLLNSFSRDMSRKNGKSKVILDAKKKYSIPLQTVVEEKVLEKVVFILGEIK